MAYRSLMPRRGAQGFDDADDPASLHVMMSNRSCSYSRRQCFSGRWGGRLLLLFVMAFLPDLSARAETRGEAVAVLFNSEMPESRELAQYYAARRGVPTNQCIGLRLPRTEVISRQEFESSLERPFTSELKSRGLIATRDDIRPATETEPGRIVEMLTDSRIRYIAVCYGVPLRVQEDPRRKEPIAPQTPEPFRRNTAAVDAELTVLPLLLTGVTRAGPIANVWAGATNAELLRPANGLFVVSRLDGPTPADARALIDRALEAEENGLLGRGYFDLRSITNPAYQPGDRWISNAWVAVSRYGFDTHLDTKPETLPAGFPLSHVAFYAGWYDQHVSGPFAEPEVEFMPGAVAYHLHSFSAASLRTTNQHWAGPLVARGITATMGMVDEPYLDGTPDVGTCFARLLFSGFTWGEAVLASQRMLSWQLTVIGDPLYRPFATNALDRAKSLAARGLGRVDWALVTLYNRKRESTGNLGLVLSELRKEPRIRFSPILQEKLGDWLEEAGDHLGAAKAYQRASEAGPSKRQRIRLLWNAAKAYEAGAEPGEAYECYEAVAASSTPPFEAQRLYERLEAIARVLNREKEAKHWTEVLEGLKSGRKRGESK